MPSKGIQVYTYISAPNHTITLSVPNHTTTLKSQRAFHTSSFEIDAAAIKWPLRRHGRFQFSVHRDGEPEPLAERWLDIDPVTGDIASRSTMDDTLLETRSVVHGDSVTCSSSA